MSTLRWNELLQEWVIVTPRRAGRPFQDKERACPFCPGQTETKGDWKVLTLENRFAALREEPGPVPLDTNIVMEAPAYGASKVIVTSRNHDQQIEDMDKEQLHRVFDEYRRVFKELDEKSDIHYVMEFENRGRAIGVSLNHPHAQVYALPFVPPRIRREIGAFQRLWNEANTCLICQNVENELKSGNRIVHETEQFVSLVPFAARLPYEVHIYPKWHVDSLSSMSDEIIDLGLMVKDTVQRYSKVFEENAYVMALHTRPSVGKHPYWHFHIEFYPPWRDRERIKYLAGIETGAWTYTNDSQPEEKAKELREAL
ncbi:galactose-1-phosphate uridylyltransferase [Candidatus Thorarchaeota archaeon]|nr:MAG: galactose-1-phosphate uridylyltransferase [Candidatus Thorarchaeota archaeon]